MDLDHNSCYRVFQARDARFDGRLFVGVKTTGIYCRPICPARTPERQNVVFFTSAAAARDAGFRPCLRCRPDVAPEFAAWNGTSTTITRALRLIETGSFDEPGIDRLAGRMGLGSRQLRRLFAKHVGASPNAVLQTRRIHLAKQLIHDSTLSMAAVAHASGFGSIRRFNETFKDLFGRPPTALRRVNGHAGRRHDGRGITVRLAYSPPFAWDEVLSFLAMRAIDGVEQVTGDRYTRSISWDGAPGTIAVAPGRRGELTLHVSCARTDGLLGIVSRARRMFDLGADSRAIDSHLAADRWLAPLVARRPGLRVPGAWDSFELAVRAVLGQQITVTGARTLAARLVAACGRPLDTPGATDQAGVTHQFPVAADLAAADLGVLGLPRARAAALRSLAVAASQDPDLLGQRRTLEEAVAALTALPGIGAWTAQYIAMRELREPDAFPATDVALIRAASRLRGRPISAAELLAHAERWRPWRAYGAAHLWASLRPAGGAAGAGGAGGA